MNIHSKFKEAYYPFNGTSAVTAIDSLLAKASKLQASDIHIDPLSKDTLIRFRIDGQMEVVGFLPKNIHDETISRLKILSGVRTDLHHVPQDGRWKTYIDSDDFNIRSSFMPTYHGENAVLRLLPAGATRDISFAKLGFIPEQVEKIYSSLCKVHGLILVTGPTGSGKTTTLHACMMEKSDQPISLLTLEDPIEYELPGIRQIHIRQSHGVTFSSGLRSALRQDPDVIMLGEIRDNETAKVAVNTVLTGHLVLSTLHTNSALEAVIRLMDMGIDEYILSSVLRMVVGQRLVRTICRSCACAGCEDCRNSGYKGRSVIAECLEIDTKISEMILRKDSLSTMKEHLRHKGYRSLLDDGNEKVDWGITTRSELARVLSS
jgi:type II secretory ATPase GspE/PulE/Tfp pilus assembly ATPase PilB-like protein